MKRNCIRVKFLYPGQSDANTERWIRQFPDRKPFWGRCQFILDRLDRNYDWLVVYNNIPVMPSRESGSAREEARINPAHSLLITSEPSSVSTYGSDYTGQFAYVLTGQEDWALQHSGKIHSQPALQWFYGDRGVYANEPPLDYNYMVANPPIRKSRDIATVCSSKAHRHTLHSRRLAFVRQLKRDLPQLDWFNREIRKIVDKAEALDAYRYHLTIENHICDHWWTEKLSDSFLGLTLPFYAGAPNAAEYFPEESFIAIDLFDYETSLERIRRAITDEEYEKRFSAIRESRRRVLDEYNTFAIIARIVEERHSEERKTGGPTLFLSKQLIRKNPVVAVRNTLEKISIRGKTLYHQRRRK